MQLRASQQVSSTSSSVPSHKKRDRQPGSLRASSPAAMPSRDETMAAELIIKALGIEKDVVSRSDSGISWSSDQGPTSQT
jgi:hypothetical protein